MQNLLRQDKSFVDLGQKRKKFSSTRKKKSSKWILRVHLMFCKFFSGSSQLRVHVTLGTMDLGADSLRLLSESRRNFISRSVRQSANFVKFPLRPTSMDVGRGRGGAARYNRLCSRLQLVYLQVASLNKWSRYFWKKKRFYDRGHPTKILYKIILFSTDL